MDEKPTLALGGGLRYGLPTIGRARVDEFLRRKLMRKMLARRTQRAAPRMTLLRRTP